MIWGGAARNFYKFVYLCVIIVYVGGGVELPSHYPQWKVEFYKLEAPSALQTSLNKLVEGR